MCTYYNRCRSPSVFNQDKMVLNTNELSTHIAQINTLHARLAEVIYHSSRDRNHSVCFELFPLRNRHTTADCRSFPTSDSTSQRELPGCDYHPRRPARVRSADFEWNSRTLQPGSQDQADNLQVVLVDRLVQVGTLGLQWYKAGKTRSFANKNNTTDSLWLITKVRPW